CWRSASRRPFPPRRPLAPRRARAVTPFVRASTPRFRALPDVTPPSSLRRWKRSDPANGRRPSWIRLPKASPMRRSRPSRPGTPSNVEEAAMSPRTTGRGILKGAAAFGAAASLFPRPGLAQAAPHVVVVGGGFAGVTVARGVKALDKTIAVTIVETNRIFTACPFSNGVIAGMRDIAAQQFTYDNVVADG